MLPSDPLATDTLSTLSTVGASLVGVVVGGVVTYAGQSRLETRREHREVSGLERKEAYRRRRQEAAAYAFAWELLAELDRASAIARRWVSNQIRSEEILDSAPTGLPTWDTHRSLFAEALGEGEWLALVDAISRFQSTWDRFLELASRSPVEESVTERKKFLPEFEQGAERVITERSSLDAILKPLIDLGAARQTA